jgi:aminoglycoside phosphotransferase
VIETLKRRFAGGEWRPVTVGMSQASVWTDGRTFIKAGPVGPHRDPGFSIRAEAERAIWLRSVGIATPEVVDYGSDGDTEWMVSRALVGRDASAPWPASMRDRVVDGLADVAAALHALPADACPFDRSLAVTIPDAAHAAAAGLVDVQNLDAARVGMSAGELLDALLADRPATEDLVVCHGDLSIPNVVFDPETVDFVGVVDLGRVGVADRHADLGIVTRSLGSRLNSQYQPNGQRRFLRRYAELVPDAVIDPAKIGYYRLLDEFF